MQSSDVGRNFIERHNQNRRRGRKRVVVVALFAIVIIFAFIALNFGSASFRSWINEFRGNLVGNAFYIESYDYFGKNNLKLHGTKVNVRGTTTEDGASLSSVLTINIDGHEMTSCGETMIFYEKGLKPDVNFTLEEIESTAGGVGDNTIIAGKINKFKNWYGKPVVVVIKTQTGIPIYAFSGKKVHYEIPSDLPKFTRITIDGKQLYIHRADYQTIDQELLKK